MAKKGSCCELCSAEAKMFCESDQARLCWDCDEKVHAANFLVAKHTRVALCQVCHCTTQWKASGPNLGRTISLCGGCVAGSARPGAGSNGRGAEEEDVDRSRNVWFAGVRRGGYAVGEEREDDGEYEDCSTDDDDDDNDYSDGNDDDEFEDDDENQVVPWSSFPPASVTSTSCSEVGEEGSSSAGDGGESVWTSGFRGSPTFLHSDGEIGVGVPITSSLGVRSRVASEEEEENILHCGLARPWKQRRVATR
ncbi:hypothetical protein V2J09_008367 [Rumex salicifolius]